MKLVVNGRDREVDAPPDMPLLWVLRDVLGLPAPSSAAAWRSAAPAPCTSTATAARSCVTPRRPRWASTPVTTIEGLSHRRHRIRCSRPGSRIDVVQCGYCQSGQIMAAAALLWPRAQADRRGHRRGDARQHLPLRHLPAHPRRDPSRGRRARREAVMSARPRIDRRAVPAPPAAAPGLVIAFTSARGARAARRRPRRRAEAAAASERVPAHRRPTTPSRSSSPTPRWARASGPRLPMLVAEELGLRLVEDPRRARAGGARLRAHGVRHADDGRLDHAPGREFDRYRQVGALARAACSSGPRPRSGRPMRANSASRTATSSRAPPRLFRPARRTRRGAAPAHQGRAQATRGSGR